MASAISANKAELLAIANSVASEKMIDKSIVIEAMEEAIQKSARNRYGAKRAFEKHADVLLGLFASLGRDDDLAVHGIAGAAGGSICFLSEST